jgi:predicted DNA-binding protein (MmcQ/YjbR family)
MNAATSTSRRSYGRAEMQRDEIIRRFKKICERLPEVTVAPDGFGHMTFRVGKKSFIIVGQSDEALSFSIKADPTTQAMLIKRGPYYRTPYIGQHGWVSLNADAKLGWSEIEDLVVDAYRLAAPKRLLKLLDQ